MEVRSIEQIAQKWARVTPGRVDDYRQGVENPRRSWMSATAASESAYEMGVQTAISKKRFGKGVKAAGDAKWSRGAITKGVSRWGPGVTVAQADYANGYAPYREALAHTTLPPRYARRDPRNLDRVAAVVNALSKAKETRLGK